MSSYVVEINPTLIGKNQKELKEILELKINEFFITTPHPVVTKEGYEIPNNLINNKYPYYIFNYILVEINLHFDFNGDIDYNRLNSKYKQGDKFYLPCSNKHFFEIT